MRRFEPSAGDRDYQRLSSLAAYVEQLAAKDAEIARLREALERWIAEMAAVQSERLARGEDFAWGLLLESSRAALAEEKP